MPELCFNLWYYLSKKQTIEAIAARAYLLSGDEVEMGAVLKALSSHEYRLSKAHRLSETIRHRYADGFRYELLQKLGIETVYAEVFDSIQQRLPKGIEMPEDIFFFATPLFDFGEGFVPAEIEDGFIRSRL